MSFDIIRQVAEMLGEKDENVVFWSLMCYLNSEISIAEDTYTFLKSRGEEDEAKKYKERLYKLLEAKGLVEGWRNGTGYGCYAELDKDPNVDYRIPLRIYCTSPVGKCRVEGELAEEVVKIESYLFDDYTEIERKIRHLLISNKYVGECGLTRVYIRADGALVLNHTLVKYSGVHVIWFKKPVWEYIRLRPEDVKLLNRNV